MMPIFRVLFSGDCLGIAVILTFCVPRSAFFSLDVPGSTLASSASSPMRPAETRTGQAPNAYHR
jgi:hypothetical protein